MKHFVFFLMFSGLLISCRTNSAKCAVRRSRINLGALMVNEVRNDSIVFINQGDDPLKILGYTSSCECTIAKIKSDDEIAGGDSLAIPIQVKALPFDKGKEKDILCTFKTNSDSVFSYIHIIYSVL